MAEPRRIQRKRQRSWKLSEGAVRVGLHVPKKISGGSTQSFWVISHETESGIAVPAQRTSVLATHMLMVPEEVLCITADLADGFHQLAQLSTALALPLGRPRSSIRVAAPSPRTSLDQLSVRSADRAGSGVCFLIHIGYPMCPAVGDSLVFASPIKARVAVAASSSSSYATISNTLGYWETHHILMCHSSHSPAHDAFKIACRSGEQHGVILKHPNSAVAVAAERPAKFARFVIVIPAQVAGGRADLTGISKTVTAIGKLPQASRPVSQTLSRRAEPAAVRTLLDHSLRATFGTVSRVPFRVDVRQQMPSDDSREIAAGLLASPQPRVTVDTEPACPDRFIASFGGTFGLWSGHTEIIAS